MKITDGMVDYWNKLGGKDGYNKLKASGLFYEIFPDLTGVWEDDKILFEPKSKLEDFKEFYNTHCRGIGMCDELHVLCEQVIEVMKCCGNCEHSYKQGVCGLDIDIQCDDNDKWELEV